MSWNYYSPKLLRRFGVSEHTPDLVEITIHRKAIQEAYCKSTKCSGIKTSKGVLKKVKAETEVCPECKMFLFWRTIILPYKEDKKVERPDQSDCQLS